MINIIEFAVLDVIVEGYSELGDHRTIKWGNFFAKGILNIPGSVENPM